MARTTNGIATWSDLAYKDIYAGSDANYCPTKMEILALGNTVIDESVHTYSDLQLVRYSDISKKPDIVKPDVIFRFIITPVGLSASLEIGEIFDFDGQPYTFFDINGYPITSISNGTQCGVKCNSYTTSLNGLRIQMKKGSETYTQAMFTIKDVNGSIVVSTNYYNLYTTTYTDITWNYSFSKLVYMVQVTLA